MDDPDAAIHTVRLCMEASVAPIQQMKHAHWPQRGNKGDVHELNYLYALARQLERRGAIVYFEVPHLGMATADDSKRSRSIDLLALHEEQAWALALEAKALTSAAEADQMRGDVAKLARPRLRRSTGDLRLDHLRCHTGLLASVWCEPTAEWWTSDLVADHPAGTQSPGAWDAVAGYLRSCAPEHRMAVDLRRSATYCSHWLVAAVRPEREPGAFWA